MCIELGCSSPGCTNQWGWGAGCVLDAVYMAINEVVGWVQEYGQGRPFEPAHLKTKWCMLGFDGACTNPSAGDVHSV